MPADNDAPQGQPFLHKGEADLFFPAQKVAVFCDGAHHARTKQRAKDAAITEKLKALDVQSVRIPGADIKFDLGKAVAAVKGALA